MSYRMGPVSMSVRTAAKAQGFDAPAELDDRPKIPSDLTMLDADDLMVLFTQLNEFANYAATQLSFAEIDERYAIRRAEEKHNELMNVTSSDSRSSKVTFQKSQAAIHPEYVALRDEVEFAIAYKGYVKTIYENLDRDLRLVSREVTRRVNNTYEQRASRWST